MTHPNDMTGWEAIGCRRDHEHRAVAARVDLARPHRYADLPQLPRGLAPPAWEMFVWDPSEHPVDGGPYCPAHDAVSATILSHGIWEPVETALVLGRLANGGGLLDFGAQVGWYCWLAAMSGGYAVGLEADPDNVRILGATIARNDWHRRVAIAEGRVGPDSATWGVPTDEPWRVVKIDLEGAEDEALRVLAPVIAAGAIEHMLIEVSPVFRGVEHYAGLVRGLMDAGYVVYRLPSKGMTRPLADPADQLVRLGDPSSIDPHQENLWCRHEGAAW